MLNTTFYASILVNYNYNPQINSKICLVLLVVFIYIYFNFILSFWKHRKCSSHFHLLRDSLSAS